MAIYSKKDIYYGVKGKEILLSKGSELWECVKINTFEEGYSFISYLYRSNKKIPAYSPFITKKKAKEIGII